MNRSCVVAAMVVLVACGPSGAPQVGRLPSSPHYHALGASGERLVLAAHDGLYLSEDDGRRWRLIDSPASHPVAATLHRRSVVVGGEGGAWRQTDDDAWEHLLGDASTVVQALAGSPADAWAWVIGAGLVRLDDPGGGPPTGPGPDDGLVALAASGGSAWAAGPNFGVFVTADGGRTWTDLEVPVPALAVGATRGEEVFVGGVDGVRRLSDSDWKRLDLDPAGPVAAIASSGEALWVLTQGGALYRSDDGGRGWATIAKVD